MVDAGENPMGMEDDAQGAVGLGLRLRLAREARGWSIAEVAQRLCLNKQVIVDIEAEEYANMPGVVYLRGFTRSYAKLLELPVDEVMRDFDALGLHQKSSHPRLQLIRTTSLKSRSKGRWLSVLTVIIIAVMIGLVVIWWHNKSQRPSDSPFSTKTNEFSVPLAPKTDATDLKPFDAGKVLRGEEATHGATQGVFTDQQENKAPNERTGGN